jgi:hypothetical protein
MLGALVLWLVGLFLRAPKAQLACEEERVAAPHCDCQKYGAAAGDQACGSVDYYVESQGENAGQCAAE